MSQTKILIVMFLLVIISVEAFSANNQVKFNNLLKKYKNSQLAKENLPSIREFMTKIQKGLVFLPKNVDYVSDSEGSTLAQNILNGFTVLLTIFNFIYQDSEKNPIQLSISEQAVPL